MLLPIDHPWLNYESTASAAFGSLFRCVSARLVLSGFAADGNCAA